MKELQKMLTKADFRRASSLRERAFFKWLTLGCKQRSQPASSRGPTASLNSGPPHIASQSSASLYAQAITNMWNHGIVGKVWTARAGLCRSQLQSVSASAKPSRRSAARNSTCPRSQESLPPVKCTVSMLHSTARRTDGNKRSSAIESVAL